MKKLFFVQSMGMLNLTIKDLRLIEEERNIDAYKSVSKNQLGYLIYLLKQLKQKYERYLHPYQNLENLLALREMILLPGTRKSLYSLRTEKSQFESA